METLQVGYCPHLQSFQILPAISFFLCWTAVSTQYQCSQQIVNGNLGFQLGLPRHPNYDIFFPMNKIHNFRKIIFVSSSLWNSMQLANSQWYIAVSGVVYNCCVKCITNSRACLYPGTHILYEVAYVLDSQNFEFREILKRRTESFCCDRLKSIASKIPRRQDRKIHVSPALVCILNNNNTSKNDNFFINNFSLSSMFD